jgi:predicted house-cleaning noncanonical NTP pyrophosphatase (MazG superfamily)
MRKRYSKLVRDSIPEIIERSGRKCSVEVMGDQAYRKALLNKLVEEAQEAAEADPEELTVEIADLYEVIDAVLAAHAIDVESVLELQRRRRAERGGFERRLKLLWTE